MSKVLKNAIEITHMYEQKVELQDRFIIVQPERFRTVDEMFVLLCFIMFEAEEIDDHAHIDSRLMCDILMEAYDFKAPDGHIMNFMAYDTYTVREAGCGKFDNKVHRETLGNEKLYEILNREFKDS